jgi:Cu-processing system ATP-binding protein
VLDEPTSGLDPVSRREFYAMLDDLAAEGAAILLSSHALTEVEARTDRIVILSKGRLVANDTLANCAGRPRCRSGCRSTARPGAADAVAAALAGGAAQRRDGRPDLPARREARRLGQVAACAPRSRTSR